VKEFEKSKENRMIFKNNLKKCYLVLIFARNELILSAKKHLFELSAIFAAKIIHSFPADGGKTKLPGFLKPFKL